MKRIGPFVCVFVVSAAVRASIVSVDGRGEKSGAFATISAALAALHRDDGEADVVQLTAAQIKETKTIAIEFRDGKTDPLSIVGAPAEGDATVVVFGDTIGNYAVEISGTPASKLDLKNLTLIPEYNAGASPLVKDFPHGGIRIRLADQAGKANSPAQS